ncbi:MAG: hypothetical protein LKG38_02815 [Atopobiaceae bacterium]|jgi:nitrogenase molybdenum-iron protein alpha/beta subunit|nr:hypothetical protein [Atopobiaceae bacterium]MCH4119473.1 hypothetical protein [Atopobiaceae bacterium]MCI1318258.1 hypothetical protein [Atopobiaceae bacterium]MCI1389060.1 hypothetical protein [Atopobiaceae bacterium]MCI1431706.1 hypothetical protein [Atopobiaceae bacterium]
MRQAYQILPVYTGDVSGVCSALFELGGMVVIHDPSGCNSTYNTHDEIRWYDQDSLIYISGLTDVDAMLGDDERLVGDVVEAVRQTSPRFVVLVSSPIPYQVGCDFAGIARLVEERTGTPVRHLATNGMHDYVRGAGIAFEALAELVADAAAKADAATAAPGGRPRRGRAVNVLGMTPLDFAGGNAPASVAAFLEAHGFERLSCWAMGSPYEEVMRSGEAALDLVVSATGMRAARVLHERLGIPYVVGMPTQGFSDALAQAMEATLEDGACRDARQDARRAAIMRRADGGEPDADVAFVGEPVQMGSLAAALAGAGARARVVSLLEDTSKLMDPALGDAAVRGEEEASSALAKADVVVGDPFLSSLPGLGGKPLVRMPHLALSGRQWLLEALDPMQVNIVELVGRARAAQAAELAN